MAKHFMLVEYFFYNLLRAADIHDVSRIRALCEMLFGVSTAVGADHPIIDMLIDLPLCLLRCFSGGEKSGSRHWQPVGMLLILVGRLPVYHKRVVILRSRASKCCEEHGNTSPSGFFSTCRGAADCPPDRHCTVFRPGEDLGITQRFAELSFPVHYFMFID